MASTPRSKGPAAKVEPAQNARQLEKALASKSSARKAVAKKAAKDKSLKVAASGETNGRSRAAGRNTTAPQTFEARLERSPGGAGLNWTIARVPLDVHQAFASMTRLRVRGTIARPSALERAFPFRTSLFPVRGLPGEEESVEAVGAFFLLVNKAMQEAADIRLGDVAHFTLEADLEDRPAELPDGLAILLDEERGLRAFYLELSESWRREIGKWINGVKGEAGRMTRCQQMAERLLSTMEAEAALPPQIERAFRLRPRARTGWQRMTVTQRRQELLGVFYYRTPESRQRRLEKLCDAAEKRA